MMFRFKNFVDKENIDFSVKGNYRYFLKLPLFHSPQAKEKKVLVILKNPSTANVDHDEENYESDPTVNSLSKYFYRKKFTEIIIVNLFAWRCKDSKDLNTYAKAPEFIIGAENDQYIEDCIDKVKLDLKKNKDSRIVVAWGGYPADAKKEMKALYKERIKKVERLLPEQGVFYVNRLVGEGFYPNHGQQWSAENEMYEYEFRLSRFLP